MPLNQTSTYPAWSETTSTTLTEVEGAFLRFKPMVTPSDVLRYGLIGIPKIFPLTGERIDEDLISAYLASAIANVEMTGLIISPILTHHVDDWHETMFTDRYFPILVNKYPVTAVESIILTYPNATSPNPKTIYTIPKDWITWERNKINVIAAGGILAPQQLGGSANIPIAMWTRADYRPSAFRVTYQAGFENDKLPMNVWSLLIDMATYDLLSDIGPLLFPTSSISVGIDNVQQSSSLPGPKLFEGRLMLLKDKIAKAKATISAYYGQTASLQFAGM
jgi:hypothetical protein